MEGKTLKNINDRYVSMEEGKIPIFIDIKKTKNSRFIGPIKIVLYLQLIMIIAYLSTLFLHSQFDRVRWRDHQDKNSIIVIDDVDYQSKDNLVIKNTDKLLNDTLTFNKMMNGELEMLPMTTPAVGDDPWIIDNDIKSSQRADSGEEKLNRDETKEENYYQNNYSTHVEEKKFKSWESMVVEDENVENIVDKNLENVVDENIKEIIDEKTENIVEKMENVFDEIVDDIVDKIMDEEEEEEEKEKEEEEVEEIEEEKVEDSDEKIEDSMEKIVTDMNEKVEEIFDHVSTMLTEFGIVLENSDENNDSTLEPKDKDDNEKVVDTTLENSDDDSMMEEESEKSLEHNYFNKLSNNRPTDRQFEMMQKICQDNDAILGVSFVGNSFEYACLPIKNENGEILVVDDDDDGSYKNKEELFEKK